MKRALLSFFALMICAVICTPPSVRAAGPLIKPAKFSLKWPWAKTKKSEPTDPFNEYGADEQRRLASHLSGQPVQSNAMTPPAAPRIQAANGYTALPRNSAGYPWPNPIDSSSPQYRAIAPATPAGQLYANTPNVGVPSAITQGNAGPGSRQPSRPVLSAPIQPATSNGSLYPRTRIPGTSVTVPTTNPLTRGAPVSPSSWANQASQGSQTRAASPLAQNKSSQNGGALYPQTPYARSNAVTTPWNNTANSASTIQPNYARTQPNNVAAPSRQMQVATIDPATGQTRQTGPSRLANQGNPLIGSLDTTTGSGPATQQVTATGPATSRLPSTRPKLPMPPSAELSLPSGLPSRSDYTIEAEPIVPKREISKASRPMTPTVPPTPTYSASPQAVARVAAIAAGVPAVSGASGTQAINGSTPKGPFFDPAQQPNYHDQYGWQHGTRQSSRKRWSGPVNSSGNTQPASATIETPTIIAAPPINNLPTAPPAPPVVPPKVDPLPTAPTTAPTTPITPAPPAKNPARLPPLPLPPTFSKQTQPAIPAPIEMLPMTVPQPKTKLQPLLPLPPIVDAGPVPTSPLAAPNPLQTAAASARSAVATIGTTMAEAPAQIELAAHQVAGSINERVQQASSAVLNTPVTSQSPATPAVPAVNIAEQVNSAVGQTASQISSSIANTSDRITAAVQQVGATAPISPPSTPAATPLATPPVNAIASAPVDMTSAWSPGAPAPPVAAPPWVTKPPATSSPAASTMTTTTIPRNATTSSAATIPSTAIPLPPATGGAMPLTSPPTSPTYNGQVNHVAPATPDMNSAFPINDSYNAVAPATPVRTSIPVAQSAPPLDGSFNASQVDQSIWGNQNRKPAPRAVLPTAPTAPINNGAMQATAMQSLTPNAQNLPNPNVAAAIDSPGPPTSTANMGPPSLGDLDKASQVVAVVGDQSILAGDLLWQINEMLKPYIGKAPEEELNKQRVLLMEKMLPRLLENKLVYLDFLRTIPRDKLPDIRKQINDEFNKSKLPDLMTKAEVKTRAELDQKLRDMGSSLQKQQDMFLEQIVGRQMVQQNVNARSEVSHDEMLEYFHFNAEKYEITAQAQWERIMVRWSDFSSRDEAKKKLQSMGNEIIRGAAFDAVAKKDSQGPRAANGGAYDWTQAGSLKSETIDRLLFSIPAGRLSRIIEDEDGAHIIRVKSRRDAGRTSFAKVQTKIKDAIQKERFEKQVEEYLAKLEQETTVWTVFDKDTAK